MLDSSVVWKVSPRSRHHTWWSCLLHVRNICAACARLKPQVYFRSPWAPYRPRLLPRFSRHIQNTSKPKSRHRFCPCCVDHLHRRPDPKGPGTGQGRRIVLIRGCAEVLRHKSKQTPPQRPRISLPTPKPELTTNYNSKLFAFCTQLFLQSFW